jgi:hypothetical protein
MPTRQFNTTNVSVGTNMKILKCFNTICSQSTTANYNASAVKIYSATNSLVHFTRKYFLLVCKTFKPTATLALYVVVNLEVEGLALCR